MNTAILQSPLSKYPSQSSNSSSTVAVENQLEYRCEECGRCFSTRQNLSTHIRRYHKCQHLSCMWPGCNKQYKHRWDLTSHINVAHKGEKVRCPNCGSCFSKKSNLHNHLKRGKGCPRIFDKSDEASVVATNARSYQSSSSDEDKEDDTDQQSEKEEVVTVFPTFPENDEDDGEDGKNENALVVDEADPLDVRDTPFMRFLKENRELLKPKIEPAQDIKESNDNIENLNQGEKEKEKPKLSNLELLADIALNESPRIKEELIKRESSGLKRDTVIKSASSPSQLSVLNVQQVKIPTCETKLFVPLQSINPVFIAPGSILINQNIALPVITEQKTNQPNLVISRHHQLEVSKTIESALKSSDVVSRHQVPLMTTSQAEFRSVINGGNVLSSTSSNPVVSSATLASRSVKLSVPEELRPLEIGKSSRHASGQKSTDHRVRCDQCGRICSTMAHLSNHIRSVHNNEKSTLPKTIKCDKCPKKFGRSSHLAEHVRTVHEGRKRVYQRAACSDCGKEFARQCSLNQHISACHGRSYQE